MLCLFELAWLSLWGCSILEFEVITVTPEYLVVINWVVVLILGDQQHLCLGLLTWSHFGKSRVVLPEVSMLFTDAWATVKCDRLHESNCWRQRSRRNFDVGGQFLFEYAICLLFRLPVTGGFHQPRPVGMTKIKGGSR